MATSLFYLDPAGARKRFLILVALGAAGLILGSIGIYDAQRANGREASILNALYESAQLFVLGGSYYKGAGFFVHIARFLCPLVTSTALVGVFRASGRWWRPLVRRVLGQHVVIVGPGDVADAMARRSESEGKRTILIARPEHGEALEKLGSASVPLMTGDLNSEAFLRRCGVDRASHVLAVSDSDSDNLSVAAALSAIESTTEKQVRVARIQSSGARLSLQQDEGILRGVRVVSLDLAERRARRFFQEHRLDHQPGPEATLVIFGDGAMARSLAVHTARVAHFPGRQKTRLVWVTPGGDADLADFYRRWPALKEVLDVTHLEGGPGDESLRRQLVVEVERAEQKTSPMVFAILGSEPFPDCLGAALWVDRICAPGEDDGIQPRLVRIVPDLSSQPGMRAMANRSEFKSRHPRVEPYSDVALHETLELSAIDPVDRLAKELHMIYLIKRDEEERQQGKHEPRDAEREWSKLDETYRASNRALADHLPIKWASVGIEVVPAEQGQFELPPLRNHQVEALARLEHDRWMAERLLAGWIPKGTRDNRKRWHNTMVPWDQLEPGDKNLDRAFVDPSTPLMKHALAKAGLGVRLAAPVYELTPERRVPVPFVDREFAPHVISRPIGSEKTSRGATDGAQEVGTQ